MHGDIGAGSNGDADVRLGKGRRIVDAVPGHGDPMAFCLQSSDLFNLAFRQNFGNHLFDAELFGGFPRRHFPVAAQEDGFQTQAVKGSDGFRGLRPQRVGDETSSDGLSVNSQKNHSCCRQGGGDRLPATSGGGDSVFFHPTPVTGQNDFPLNTRPDAESYGGLKILQRQIGDRERFHVIE